MDHLNKSEIDVFFHRLGNEMFNSLFVIDGMGWDTGGGAVGISIYCGNGFIPLWMKAFVRGDEKAKKELINKYYGGPENFEKLRLEIANHVWDDVEPNITGIPAEALVGV